ncbi:MAG: SDR family oxidoreductase [Acidobacteria bacterium]|nr:SDR family oxidoreductase [Acidobacteriota bacterium]
MAKSDSFNVVTGGAGFIGSHLTRALLRRGGRVRVIDNFSTGKRENMAELMEQFPDTLELCEHDIRDLEGLQKLFSGGEVIFHHAAIPSVQKSVENPLESNSANVEGTLKVLIAARYSSARKVIYAASSSVYGNSEELPKHEGMKPQPMSPYAIDKYAGELYCKAFSDIYKLPTLSLRYFNIFGPHQDPDSPYAAVIPRFIARMLAGKPPVIYDDGEQSRDFTFVHNAVIANLKASESKASGISMNIACGDRFSLNEVVRLLNEILGTSLKPVYEPSRLGDVRHSQADVSLAESAIGFLPEVGFREGLRRTVEWFQKKTLD